MLTTAKSKLVVSAIGVVLLAFGDCFVHRDKSTKSNTPAVERQQQQEQQQRRSLFIPIALGEDNNLAPLSDYARIAVCLDTTYVNTSVVPDCTTDQLIQFTNDPNPTGRQFRYQDQGPPSLQGVFWLSGLKRTDSIITFAATPNVGGGISTGVWEKDNRGYHYRLRVRGDRSWAFAAADYFDVSETYDPVMLFRLIKGTLEEPLKFSIYGLRSYFGIFRWYFGLLFGLFNYNIMELVTDDSVLQEYEGSFVWQRRTYFFFWNPISYRAIQVVDGFGQPIEPAYSKWVEYQQSNEAGESPNWNYFDYLS